MVTLENNPWLVASKDDFLYYCCPECDMKSKEYDRFYNHAIYSHELARKTLMINPYGHDVTISLPKKQNSKNPVILSLRSQETKKGKGVKSSEAAEDSKSVTSLTSNDDSSVTSSVTQNVTQSVIQNGTQKWTKIDQMSLKT